VEVFDGAAVTEAGFEVGTPVVAPEDADTEKSVLAEVGAVATGLAVGFPVADWVAEAPSIESLDACDCNADTWLDMLEFSHRLMMVSMDDSRVARLETWWSKEYVIIHC